MISGLLRTSEYAREFLHLACGPLSYGQDEDEIDWMVAKLSEFRLYDDLVIVESIVGSSSSPRPMMLHDMRSTWSCCEVRQARAPRPQR